MNIITEMSIMEVIRSNKGSEKLCYEGYTFTKKHTTKSTIRWECSKRGSIKCTGAVVTNLAVTETRSSKVHTHAADPFEIEVQKVKAEIKASAESNRGSTAQIVTDQMQKYPVQVRSLVGHMDSVKRSVRRTRRAQAPSEPSSMDNIPYPIPEQYSVNSDKSEFVIYDNGSDSSRLIIFGSETGLRLLEKGTTWFMDGTHDVAPKQFSQLFVIRVPLEDTHVSAVYGFLPSKNQSCYEEFLSSILDVCLQKNIRPNPVRVVADFEIGIHNAVKTVLGNNIEIQGCFYHLTQSTWRKLQAEGLQAAYLATEEIRHFCGKIDGLAFLPVEDVSRGMEILKEEAPECMNSVVDYFDSTYVSGGFRSVRGANGVLRFRRTPPRYELQTWNVNAATLQDSDRTNNVCEGWNNKFTHLIGHSNPSIWTVINGLQKDNMDVETCAEKVRLGLSVKSRKHKKSEKLQRRLKTLCTQYGKGDKSLSDFLNAVGSCIRLH